MGSTELSQPSMACMPCVQRERAKEHRQLGEGRILLKVCSGLTKKKKKANKTQHTTHTLFFLLPLLPLEPMPFKCNTKHISS